MAQLNMHSRIICFREIVGQGLVVGEEWSDRTTRYEIRTTVATVSEKARAVIERR
jgi:hypothetical protein